MRVCAPSHPRRDKHAKRNRDNWKTHCPSLKVVDIPTDSSRAAAPTALPWFTKVQHLAASDCDPPWAAAGLTERSLARTPPEEMHGQLRRAEHSEYRFGCHISGRGQVREIPRLDPVQRGVPTLFGIAAGARTTPRSGRIAEHEVPVSTAASAAASRGREDA